MSPLTKHGQRRARQRLGWSKEATQRMIPRVLEQGTPPDLLRGSLACWVRNRTLPEAASAVRVYHDWLFIFGSSAGVGEVCLITVLEIPRVLLGHRVAARWPKGNASPVSDFE